jgi:hypothetical protein
MHTTSQDPTEYDEHILAESLTILLSRMQARVESLTDKPWRAVRALPS